MTKRPIRIANCSGAHTDYGYHMFRQATAGPVDAITGDYLAEMNLANNAKAMAKNRHPGYEPTALDGLLQSVEVINEKRIKIVINGGALNPKGLAEIVDAEAKKKGLNLSVAWVEGDNLMSRCKELLRPGNALCHLDSDNRGVVVDKKLMKFLDDPEGFPIVSANAYLGARGIFKALENGADIVICGRVADASPVVGLSQWWHRWSLEDYDCLAGALLAGHLIECSSYITGANFSGFGRYPLETFIDLGFGIAEIEHNGDCVITKHESLNGLVNEDTVRSQLLYELQGNIYLNSDVKADIGVARVQEIGTNRVRVTGTKGFPPPPTTKFAVFYEGGYQSEAWVGATGTASDVNKKRDLIDAQIEYSLSQAKMRVDVLEVQIFGRPEPNPSDEAAGTAMIRIFVQTDTLESAKIVRTCLHEFALSMQHYSGYHWADQRTRQPKPFLVFYPALIEQSEIREVVHILPNVTHPNGLVVDADPVQRFEDLEPRLNYETAHPVDLEKFGPKRIAPLGSVVWARSGDKGGNLNVGFFVHRDDEYEWLRAYLTREKVKDLLGGDWRDHYFIERCEFPGILAVHFVVYGILGRGVSSSTILDSLGKGFADYLCARFVEMPEAFIDRYCSSWGGTTNMGRSWSTSSKSCATADHKGGFNSKL